MTLKCITPIKYTDKSGEEKTTWRTVGRAWKNDDKLKISLDTIPVGQGWDGTIMVVKDDKPQRKESSSDGWDKQGDAVPF